MEVRVHGPRSRWANWVTRQQGRLTWIRGASGNGPFYILDPYGNHELEERVGMDHAIF